jgi:hypothetical protein
MENEIGAAAGAVWSLLQDRGPLTTARIRNAAKLPSGVVNMAIGWLAREDKVGIVAKGRDFVVQLK